jgi:hypothetical protein
MVGARPLRTAEWLCAEATPGIRLRAPIIVSQLHPICIFQYFIGSKEAGRLKSELRIALSEPRNHQGAGQDTSPLCTEPHQHPR